MPKTYQIRVRSEHSKAEEIRRRALKLGSCSVTTRPATGVNIVETLVEFKKIKDKSNFESWLKKKCKDCNCNCN